jgi:hypothetical protein
LSDDWESQGPPEFHPMPDGRRRSSTTLIIVGAAAAAVLVVALVVWAVAASSPPTRTTPAANGNGSNTVTESFVVTGPSGADTSTVVTELPSSGPPTETTAAPAAVRLAFRVGEDLWVADETGGHSRKLLAGRVGPFSLSPDGKTIALVDARARQLALVDVGSSRITTVTSAEPVAPVWAPSSSWLAYVTKTAAGSQVHRCSNTGDGDVLLGGGDRPAIAPDDKTYAFVSQVGRLTVAAGGRSPRALSVSGRVDEIALTADRVVYALGGQQRSDLSIHSAHFDGTDDRLLVGPPAEANAGRYARLLPSPTGMLLAYTAVGDDGFSSLKTIRLDGSGAASLSRRRSDYPVRWSADASRLFFIEGNAEQGQETSLMSARPDGTQRTTVIADAGL